MAIETYYADLLNELNHMARTPHYHAGRSTLVKAETLILSLENKVIELKKELAQAPKPMGPTYHGTYCGPLSLWHGKSALLNVVLMAQFDDRGQYTAYGWHGFELQDFMIKEVQDGNRT